MQSATVLQSLRVLSRPSDSLSDHIYVQRTVLLFEAVADL